MTEPVFAIIINLSETDPADLSRMLLCLIRQKYSGFTLFAKQSTKQLFDELPADTEGVICKTTFLSDEDFLQSAIETIDENTYYYSILIDHCVLYSLNYLKSTAMALKDRQIEVLSNPIYADMSIDALPVSYNTQAAILYNEGSKDEASKYDFFWFNKTVKTTFLKRVFRTHSNSRDALVAMYSAAKIEFAKAGIITGLSSDDSLFSHFYEPVESSSDSENSAFQYICSEEYTLSSTKQLKKLLSHTAKGSRGMLLRMMVLVCRCIPVKDRVLFYSVRSNRILRGNIRALFEKTDDKKVAFAHESPHSLFLRLYSIWLLSTSKVIIVDDYVNYLRYLPLKKTQRVIQIWHACGAFKCFGRRGTGVSDYIDSATHAQYSLVTTSCEIVKNVYADAFNISINRVKALGVPSTDCLFDKEYMATTQENIYRKHPEWIGHKIILYAPTFRDVDGMNRSEYRSPLNFECLSAALPDNTYLLVCPHPVMRCPIIEKKYSNIEEIRDFSTIEMMIVSDLLITDYSSVIFEYSLLGKPMAFFCYDSDSYTRSFYLRFPDDLPGVVIKTQNELESYLNSPEVFTADERVFEFAEKYMKSCDGKSSERISAIIHSYMRLN